MKLGKIIAISIGLVFIVSAAWAWNQNGNGNGHHGKGYHMEHQNCNGQQGEGFIDKNNDGICDNFVNGEKTSGRKFRNCYASKGRMIKMSHCPGWQKSDAAAATPERRKEDDNTAKTE